jgi:polyhydroxyalkanoate synthesis repressor PhaR
MTEASKSSVTIKKYANRRLYNTATSSYVTLDNLSQMVKEGIEFNVYDAKTSEDITRSVLTQIIVEEEGKAGQNLLPISFMRQLISFYGDNMQWLVPKYLDHSMQSLSKNQDQLRSYFQNAFGGMFPFGTTLGEMGKQNMAMFERAMQMFAPFTVPGLGATAKPGAAPAKDAGKPGTTEDEDEAAAEDAFKPSGMKPPAAAQAAPAAKPAVAAVPTPAAAPKPAPASVMPTPATTQASSQPVSGEDVQNKIAALQRQLADLAKKA